MRRVLLWIGITFGALLLGIGLIALLGTSGLPADQQAGAVIGSLIFMAIGVAIGAPCVALLIRAARRPWKPESELEALYRQWFSWAQSQLGADEITANGAAIAALSSGGAPSQAQAVAQSAASRLVAQRGVIGAASVTKPAKLNLLTVIAAAAVPLLEPGEQVLLTVRGEDRRSGAVLRAFGLVGHMIAETRETSYSIVVTDRRVLAFKSTRSARRPRTVAWALPRSEIALSVGWALFGARRLTLRWQGGLLVLTLARRWRPEAELVRAGSQLLAPALISP